VTLAVIAAAASISEYSDSPSHAVSHGASDHSGWQHWQPTGSHGKVTCHWHLQVAKPKFAGQIAAAARARADTMTAVDTSCASQSRSRNCVGP
jgi:hypothetical protein